MHFAKAAPAVGLSLVTAILAIDLDLNNEDSIRDAAKTITDSIIIRYHKGSGIPGLFGQPYYFWESGLAWDSLINYQYLTGDTSYNDLIFEALMSQVGPERDFMPPNQTKSEGNDDQAYWALAAMTAAEWGFPEPRIRDNSSNVTWVQLAQNVFNEQAARWDNGTCNGGLRWQIFAFNNGYTYKNSMSNGAFFQLANRLRLYTGNETYTDWASSALNWALGVGLIANISDTLNAGSVYDGTSAVDGNCTQINHIEWTATIAQYLAGTAYWWNATRSLYGQNYIQFFARANETFASLPNAVSNGTLTEVACAQNDNCNTDQLAFRAVLARAMAQVRDLTVDTRLYKSRNETIDGQTVPIANRSEPLWTIHERINFILGTSALGAAAQCSGGKDGTTCGNSWGNSTFDGSQGLGQDLSALNIILANLPAGRPANSSMTKAAPAPASNGTTTAGGLGNGSSGGAPAQATASGASGISASSFALLAGIAFAIAFCV